MTFLVKWNGAYYTKNVLISKYQRFSACTSWFTKDQEGGKIYSASGNKVLDTFSTIQYVTICCLCHANIIMPSAIWLELSNLRVALSQVTKCHSEHQSLFIHIREGLGTGLLPNMLHCSWSLHPNCVLNLHLRHPFTFAYRQTGRTFSIFLKFTLLLPITLPPVSMTMFLFGIQCMCVKLLHRQTIASLILRHLSGFYPTF